MVQPGAAYVSELCCLGGLHGLSESRAPHPRTRVGRYQRVVGEKHRSYAATLNNLGLVFLAQAQQAGKKVEAAGFLHK